MKAYILKEYNSPNWLYKEEVELPELQEGNVRVKIKALSVNPVDYKIAEGVFSLPVPRIIGIDFAGDVSESKSSIFKEGERVFGLANLFVQGCFAEYVDVNPHVLARIPEGLDYKSAAVIPCAGVTAWQAIMEKVVIPAGSFIFITSGGGGVGGFAIQFAKLLHARIITTASKDFTRIHDLGADYIINYKTESIPHKVNEITNGENVKTVIDMVSPESAFENCQLLRYNGSLVTIQGLPDKAYYPQFFKALTISEVALGAAYTGGDNKSLDEIAKAAEEIATLMVAKKVVPMISQEYAFDELPEAFTQLATRSTAGKVVITL